MGILLSVAGGIVIAVCIIGLAVLMVDICKHLDRLGGKLDLMTDLYKGMNYNIEICREHVEEVEKFVKGRES